MTKNRDPHRLHLHPLALKVLDERRKAHAQADGDQQKSARIMAAGVPRSSLVFPAPLSGGVVDTFSTIKVALVKVTEENDGEEQTVELLAGLGTTSAGHSLRPWARPAFPKPSPTRC